MIRKTVVATIFAAAAIGLMVPVSGFSQTDHSGHATDAANPDNPDAAAPEQAYRRAMDKMHEDMGKIVYSGNPDVDFVRGMIPHHQAAIDMAKVLIAHGKDTEIKKLAEDIVTAQEQEIDMMEAWLKANAPK